MPLHSPDLAGHHYSIQPATGPLHYSRHKLAYAMGGADRHITGIGEETMERPGPACMVGDMERTQRQNLQEPTLAGKDSGGKDDRGSGCLASCGTTQGKLVAQQT